MTDLADRIRARFDDACFACGRENPVGLGIDGFSVDGAVVRARYRPRPEHRGISGRLHGGLTATALDEVMAWTAILLAGVVVVTGTMEIRYRRPAPLEGALALSGEVEARRGRRLRLAGRLTDDEGVIAEGSGLYLATADVADLFA